MTLLPLIGEKVDVLHPPRSRSDDARGGGDIDCVVEGLDELWPLRLPGNVRLLQRLHYDVTGWFWVLEAAGRIVKVDTLDDRKGIGSYGLPTRLWFEARDDSLQGIRAAYLTAKRIRKDNTANVSWEHVHSLAVGSPTAFKSALEEMFGPRVGERLAKAVIEGGNPPRELWGDAERALWRRRLRDPARAASFLFRTVARIRERISRPTGLVVLVTGPDGSGKSTLARSLPDVCEGAFRRALHLHWRPGILPALGRLVGASEGDVIQPHARPPHGRIVSLGRLLYYFLDFVVGSWVRITPCRLKTGLVIVERGWWDIAVDPRRYRMRVPRSFVTALGRLTPRPDVVLVLEAPVDVLFERKQEISPDEARRQSEAWRTVLPSRVPRVFLDASTSIDQVQREARQRIFEHLEQRAIGRLGSGWVGVPSRQSPRWLLPRGGRHVARSALSIYQPVTASGLVGWQLARAAAAVGAFRLTRRTEALPRAARAMLAPHLPRGATLATMKANHPHRFVTAVVSERGDVLAVAKMAFDDGGQAALAKEADALVDLALKLPPPLRAPAVLERADGLVLLEACRWRPRVRPWMLPEDVAEALGAFYRLTAAGDGGNGAAHGDFAPWNLLQTSNGWVLIDWEHARRTAPPYLDVFHYIVQAHALLKRPTRRQVLSGIAGDEGWVGRAIRAYALGAAVDADDALEHLSRYLESSIPMLDSHASDGRKGIVARRALLREVEHLS